MQKGPVPPAHADAILPELMKASGNTVLITEGDSCIGLALAEAFVQAGNEVIICGKTQARLDDALERLPALQSFTCDITSKVDRRLLMDCILEYFPRFNMLVNNAAIAEITDLTHPESADRVAKELAVDLQAPVLLTMQFLPHLIKQQEAAVVNVLTASDASPANWYPIYSAAAAGLHSFSQSLRRQLRDTSVSVFEVLPPAAGARRNGKKPARIGPTVIAGQILAGMHRNISKIRLKPAYKRNAVSRLLIR